MNEATLQGKISAEKFQPPARILLGPGPSMVDPRVLAAMAQPLVGHLDPYFIQLMNQIQDLLRYVFGTSNRLTIPVSGTGSAAMETAVANMVEPGDKALVCINGYFWHTPGRNGKTLWRRSAHHYAPVGRGVHAGRGGDCPEVIPC